MELPVLVGADDLLLVGIAKVLLSKLLLEVHPKVEEVVGEDAMAVDLHWGSVSLE